MKKILIITMCIVVAIVLVAGCCVLYVVNTPEYALAKICEQAKESGFDAVLPNLTEEAYEKVEPIIVIAKNDIVQSIIAYFSDSDIASVLIDKTRDIEWSVGDVLKNQEKASVTISFSYEDKISGSIDLELLKKDGEWKINDLYNLDVAK